MPRRIPRFACVSFFFVATALVGCGGTSTDSGTVNGTVTLDGKPLKEGLVTFVSIDGKSQPASGPIIDGKFSVKVSTGEMKVMFSASKVIGKKKMYDTPDSPSVDEVKELLPDKYNAQSQYKLTVKGGVQSETYPLTMK